MVRAVATEDLAQKWSSHAEFVADSAGIVDLSRLAPTAGSYSVADPNGLLWSMTLDPSIVERTPFVKTTSDPVSVTLSAAIDGKVVDQATLTRRFLAPGIVQSPRIDDGLVATMFHH